MKIGYTDILFEMSHQLCQALLEREPDLAQRVHELDGEVNKILRRLGFFVVSLVLAELSNTVNPMLALRIIRANSWWEKFWTQKLVKVKIG